MFRYFLFFKPPLQEKCTQLFFCVLFMRRAQTQNLPLLQRYSVISLWLIFSYTLSILYSFSHIHNEPHTHSYYVSGVRVDNVHYSALKEDPGHEHDDAHHCLACQFQSDSAVYGTSHSSSIPLTTHNDFLLATSQAFNTTPTKRLTRAPPVIPIPPSNHELRRQSEPLDLR